MYTNLTVNINVNVTVISIYYISCCHYKHHCNIIDNDTICFKFVITVTIVLICKAKGKIFLCFVIVYDVLLYIDKPCVA